MPKFVTIGCGDRAGYERTPPEVCNSAHAHDEVLRKRGALMGVAGSPFGGERNEPGAHSPPRRLTGKFTLVPPAACTAGAKQYPLPPTGRLTGSG